MFGAAGLIASCVAQVCYEHGQGVQMDKERSEKWCAAVLVSVAVSIHPIAFDMQSFRHWC